MLVHMDIYQILHMASVLIKKSTSRYHPRLHSFDGTLSALFLQTANWSLTLRFCLTKVGMSNLLYQLQSEITYSNYHMNCSVQTRFDQYSRPLNIMWGPNCGCLHSSYCECSDKNSYNWHWYPHCSSINPKRSLTIHTYICSDWKARSLCVWRDDWIGHESGESLWPNSHIK